MWERKWVELLELVLMDEAIRVDPVVLKGILGL